MVLITSRDYWCCLVVVLVQVQASFDLDRLSVVLSVVNNNFLLFVHRVISAACTTLPIYYPLVGI